MGELDVKTQSENNSSVRDIYIKLETNEKHIFKCVTPTPEMKRVLDVLKSLWGKIKLYKKYVDDMSCGLHDCFAHRKLNEFNAISEEIVEKGFLKNYKFEDGDTYFDFLYDLVDREDDEHETNENKFFSFLKIYFQQLTGDKLEEFGVSCKNINFCAKLDINKHLWEDIYGEEDETDYERYKNIPKELIYDFSDIISLEYLDGDEYDDTLFI